MRVLVSGGAGFIGSHMTDLLISQGHEVIVLDNLLTGSRENINPKAEFRKADIRGNHLAPHFRGVDWVFHFAAIARTQWTIDDPILANDINTNGTLNVLLAARDAGVKRFVHSSSCIVYVETTPYWVTKQAAENFVSIFPELYGMSTVSLRYSNVYGSLRQSEKGPAINVLASLRKSKRETGKIFITGDGEQSRDFIHVDDVVRANLIAAQSTKTGAYDICTGVQTSLNTIAKAFDCPVEYGPERAGDVKALVQDPTRAELELGFKAEKPFDLSIYL